MLHAHPVAGTPPPPHNQILLFVLEKNSRIFCHNSLFYLLTSSFSPNLPPTYFSKAEKEANDVNCTSILELRLCNVIASPIIPSVHYLCPAILSVSSDCTRWFFSYVSAGTYVTGLCCCAVWKPLKLLGWLHFSFSAFDAWDGQTLGLTAHPLWVLRDIPAD